MSVILNKETKKILNVTDDDYLRWCRKYGYKHYETKNKSKFVEDIREGKLVRDVEQNNCLVYRRKEND